MKRDAKKPKKEKFSLWMDPALLSDLRHVAARTDRSMAYWARKAIEEYVRIMVPEEAKETLNTKPVRRNLSKEAQERLAMRRIGR